MYAATREEVLELFQQAKRSGLSLDIMSELAGRSLVPAMKRLKYSTDNHIVIIVGGGTNGSCGLAGARHLVNNGFQVQLIMLEAPANEAARAHLKVAEEMHLPIWYWQDESITCAELLNNADIIIEAIFGHGLIGDPRGAYAEVLDGMRQISADIISFDIPAGLDIENGMPGKYCIKPKVIIALGIMKKVLENYIKISGSQLTIFIADLGVPSMFYDMIQARCRPTFNADGLIEVI